MRRYLLLLMAVQLFCSSGISARPTWQAQIATDDSRPQSGFLQRFLGSSGPEQLLPPAEAFMVFAVAMDPRTIAVHFIPAKDHYFYRDKLMVSIQDPTDIKIDSVDWPHGELKSDPFFGNTEVLERSAEAVVHVKRVGSQALVITLRVEHQGCNYVVGICYTPVEKWLRVDVPPPGAAQ